MTTLFLRVLEMSLAACVVILVIMLARLPLKRAPKKWSYMLWLAAAFRLCCPVSLGSAFSIFNLSPAKAAGSIAQQAAQTVPDAIPTAAVPSAAANAVRTAAPVFSQQPVLTAAPHATAQAIQTAAPALTAVPDAAASVSTAAPALSTAEAVAAAPVSPVDAGELLLKIAAALWIIGAAVMLAIGVYRYILSRRRTKGAQPMPGREGIFVTEAAGTPFILGLFRPRIYVPDGLTDAELAAVLAHERCHIKRGDNIIKPLAYAILCVHWFDPLCWAAFRLMSRDMEMSCDERVIEKGFDPADYGNTLLTFAANRRFPSPEPTAFIESDASRRIKNVLGYKKPKLIVSVLIAVFCCALLAACSLNAKQTADDDPALTAGPTESPTEQPEQTPVPTKAPVPELITLCERPRAALDSQSQFFCDSLGELDTWGTAYYLPENGDLWVLGSNRYYQTGRGQLSDYEGQTYVWGRIVSFRADNGRVYALNADGDLWTWGVNAYGNLEGVGCSMPWYIVGGVKDYDANYALTEKGELYCIASFDPEKRLDGDKPEKVMDGITSFAGVTYQWCYAIDTEGILYYCERVSNNDGAEWKTQAIGENAASAAVCVYNTAPFVIKKDGELCYYSQRWEPETNTYTFEEKHIADGVKFVLPYYDAACFIKKDGTLWSCAGEAGEDLGFSENIVTEKLLDSVKYVTADRGMGEHLGIDYAFAITGDDRLWAWGANYYGELGLCNTHGVSKPVCVAEDVAMVCTDGFTTYIVKNDGSLWGTGYNGFKGSAWEESGAGLGISPEDARLGDGTRTTRYGFVKIMEDVESVDINMSWIRIFAGELGYGQATVSRTVALKTDGTVWAWGYNEDGCIVNGGDKYILSPVEIMRPDAPLIPENMEETFAVQSQHEEYYRTANAILAGEHVEDIGFSVYSQYVWFRLEDDGFKAYSKKTVHQTLTPSLEMFEEVEYSGLLAVYPREVGELANRRLCEYANEYAYYNTTEDSYIINEGVMGDNWFALVTEDETMQDIQVHCLFYNDGGEWKEIKPNNGGLYIGGSEYGWSQPVFGACVASDRAAYINYFGKNMWDEETGYTRPYVYRTADGGNSWQRLDLTLPESYLQDVGCAPLSPVFDGDHGVIIIAGLHDGHMAWFETYDNGLTWEYRIND